MSQLMIRAENVSKYYRLGALGSTTAKEDLRSWWQRITQSASGAVLPLEQLPASYLWALKNIHFEASRGEVLGFMGNNGAGKSTLLKIISRVTLPSSGRILGKGKIASLLEVGTGFHQQLSGRENIYLNGHVLGMKKKEIDKKFDEIVHFSGIEQFLDTPVKRYSSGMYVRLAFSIAAHLDPDILIVDEVLAVGDDSFQKKCIHKMMELASQKGKTILFVSHNKALMHTLCDRILVLEGGEIVDEIGKEIREQVVSR